MALVQSAGQWPAAPTVLNAVIEIQPKVITVSAVRDYLVLFKARGLVSEKLEAGLQYDPTSPEDEVIV